MNVKEFEVALETLGLSKSEFAEQTGLTVGGVNKWIRNQQFPGWLPGYVEGQLARKRLLALKVALADINQF